MTTEQQNATAEITVGGVTRTIELAETSMTRNPTGSARRAFVPGVVATIGQGRARYPDVLLLNRVQDGESTRGRGEVVTDSSGRVWTYHMETVVRNRQAWIVAWEDEAPVTNYNDNGRS